MNSKGLTIYILVFVCLWATAASQECEECTQVKLKDYDMSPQIEALFKQYPEALKEYYIIGLHGTMMASAAFICLGITLNPTYKATGHEILGRGFYMLTGNDEDQEFKSQRSIADGYAKNAGKSATKDLHDITEKLKTGKQSTFHKKITDRTILSPVVLIFGVKKEGSNGEIVGLSMECEDAWDTKKGQGGDERTPMIFKESCSHDESFIVSPNNHPQEIIARTQSLVDKLEIIGYFGYSFKSPQIVSCFPKTVETEKTFLLQNKILRMKKKKSI